MKESTPSSSIRIAILAIFISLAGIITLMTNIETTTGDLLINMVLAALVVIPIGSINKTWYDRAPVGIKIFIGIVVALAACATTIGTIAAPGVPEWLPALPFAAMATTAWTTAQVAMDPKQFRPHQKEDRV